MDEENSFEKDKQNIDLKSENKKSLDKSNYIFYLYY